MNSDSFVKLIHSLTPVTTLHRQLYFAR